MLPTFPPQSPYRWPRPGLFKGTTHQRPFSFLHSDSTMQRQQQVSFQNCIKKKIRVGLSGTARGHRFISQIMRRPGAQGPPCTTARICREQGGLRNSDSTQQPRAVKKKPSTRSSNLDLAFCVGQGPACGGPRTSLLPHLHHDAPGTGTTRHHI